MIKGILFDMDGVLVDSEKFICQAAIKMFSEYGITAQPEDFIPYVGQGENTYLGGVAKKYNLDKPLDEIKKRTYDIYGEMVDGKLSPLPGVHDFIKKAKANNLKIAVATSADRVKMEINLKNIGLTENTFDATVNGLEVELKKPAPDIFILAAEKLGLSPAECLVVEDAISGVTAAKKAGAQCLALLTSFKKEELLHADWHSNTLADAPDACLQW